MTVFEQGYVICPTSTFIYILSLGYKDTAANDIVMQHFGGFFLIILYTLCIEPKVIYIPLSLSFLYYRDKDSLEPLRKLVESQIPDLVGLRQR